MITHSELNYVLSKLKILKFYRFLYVLWSLFLVPANYLCFSHCSNDMADFQTGNSGAYRWHTFCKLAWDLTLNVVTSFSLVGSQVHPQLLSDLTTNWWLLYLLPGSYFDRVALETPENDFFRSCQLLNRPK